MLLRDKKRLLITGGAGFIGSCFIRYTLQKMDVEKLVNLDLLTYAGNLSSLVEVAKDPRYVFVQGDIVDAALVEKLCTEHSIDTIVHFAAESHVDRSIEDPLAFFETNVRGTLQLLEVVRRLPHIHFHHVSTDEVYGSLGPTGAFSESSAYKPNSPYAASKAASDHFVRAYAHTYGIFCTLSHSSNNFGPYQCEEKFIPHMITRCLQGKTLPVYGSGKNIRDWLYVEDHVEALWAILQKGKKGEVYDIGGGCEKSNIDLLQEIIALVARYTGEDVELLSSYITFVKDRPGHDFRYAIDSSKIKNELSFQPQHDFSYALEKTVLWYIEKQQKVEAIS